MSTCPWVHMSMTICPYGHLDMDTATDMGIWTYGHMDIWTYGHVEMWTCGHLDIWIQGHFDVIQDMTMYTTMYGQYGYICIHNNVQY